MLITKIQFSVTDRKNIMKIIRKVQVKIPHYICDVCNKEVKTIKSCIVCKRDVCPACRYDDYSYGGDYPEIYCKHCWELGQPYREQIELIEDEADSKIDQETEAWHNLCKSIFLKIEQKG